MKSDAISAATRIQLRNILFATDFSAAARAALPWAASLAQHYGSRLYAVHVCPSTFSPPMRGLQAMARGRRMVGHGGGDGMASPRKAGELDPGV